MLLCIDYIHCTGLVHLFTNRLYTGPALCIDTSIFILDLHNLQLIDERTESVSAASQVSGGAGTFIWGCDLWTFGPEDV